MSKSLTINAPQIVQTRNTLNAVPSGSTAEPDYNVKYVPQDLTEEQQAQARQNIGAISESEIPASAQANWNETDTDSPAYIQNKPTIPAAQVQSDWNQSDDTAVDYIKNKPSIPENIIPEDVRRNCVVYSTKDTDFAYVGNGTFAGVYENGIWNTNQHISRGRNVLVASGGGPENQGYRLGDLSSDYVILISDANGGGIGFSDHDYWTSPFTGKVTYIIGTRTDYTTRPVDVYGFRQTKMSDYNNLTTVFLVNIWTCGGDGFEGNYIFVDKPFGQNEFSPVTTLQDTTNLKNLYVPRTRKQELITWFGTIYDTTQVDITPLTSKIVEYDFLTWVDDHTPRMITLS